MTTFNLEEKRGVWFDLDGGGRVQIRLATAETMKDILKVAGKTRIEYKRVDGKAERFVVDDVNEDLRSELFWDHVIVSWENFFDGSGNVIPCTTEAKIRLMARSQLFSGVVVDALKTLTEGEASAVERHAKNS